MTKSQQQEENSLSAQLMMFGHRLKIAREKAGLTQKELAEQFGTSQRVQSGYERGIVAPKVDYLFKLEQMGINTRLLLFGDQHLYELNSREQTLLELYRQMNEHMQLQTLGLLLARITEGNTPNGDNNSNSALIAGIQSIKTSQKKP